MLSAESSGPVAAESRLAVGSGLRRPRLPRSQRAVLAGFTATCVAVLLALLATAFPADLSGGALPSWLGGTVIFASSATEAPPLPVSPPQPARRTQPRAVTLQPSDLPAGSRVSKEGPASFSSGAQPPPSWDVVLRPDPAHPADYEFAESLAVVYPSTRVAGSALASVGDSERSGGATQLAAASRVGDRESVWLEQTPSRPGEAIVRVAWQSMNVVGEVSILAPAGGSEVQRALDLAQVEQGRIGAPVSFEEEA